MASEGASHSPVERAATQLMQDGLVAFATETVYGLGASASSESGVRQIYERKGRPANHPLIVHVSGISSACYWAELGPMGVALAGAFWPGPMTLIAQRRPGVPAYACGREPTIGLRCPSHPLAQSLMQRFEAMGGRGIAAPSANLFGGVSPTTAAHVTADFGGNLTVLDGGPCAVGLESTIVDISTGYARVLRPGSITSAKINDVLAAHGFEWLLPEASSNKAQANRPRVSGSLAAHYAPSTELELVASAQLPERIQSHRRAGRKIACCSFGPVSAPVERVELASTDPARFSVRLYAMLRDFDRAGVDVILVEEPPGDIGWEAVNDRLGRAQTGSGLRDGAAN